ncbi:MAG: ABC transporter substrate-binding protein, partial [Methyloligellaceae bacterium]
MKRLFGALAMLLGLAALGASGSSASAACGRITVSDMNWASAELAAHVDKFILENGYGCDVELIPGDTMPTTSSMTEKGEPDIAPEIWMNSVRQVIDKAVGEGRLKIAGEILNDGGEEGWWIPKYMVGKHPELTTLDAVLKRPDLFPNPENKSRGALHNCPSGWNCQIITANLYKANEVEKAGFDLIDTGSAAGLDGSIAKAYNRKQGWFGYYWAPTAILGKYEMVKLDMGVDHDPDEWNRCTGQDNCVDPKKNNWTKSVVMTVTSSRFTKLAPEATKYLSKRSWSNSVVNTMLAYMDETQAGGEEGAEKFLKDYENVWTKWVPADIAKKVKAAL